MADDDAPAGTAGPRLDDRSDEELVRPALAAPDGPHRAELEQRLGTYASEVLTGWARGGQLRKQAAKARSGRGVLGLDRVPVELDASRYEAEMVVADMFVMALRGFWGRPLREWDPAGQARVKTYFVTYCLMQLPGAYDKFFRRELKPLLVEASNELVSELVADTDPGPEEIAEIRERIAQLAKRDPRLQRKLLMRLAGYTYREIAERLTEEGLLTTEGQVRGELNRVARNARDQGRRRDDLS